VENRPLKDDPAGTEGTTFENKEIAVTFEAFGEETRSFDGHEVEGSELLKLYWTNGQRRRGFDRSGRTKWLSSHSSVEG